MIRQIVVTCEHGHRTEHWLPNDFDLHGTICPGGIIVDLGSLPPAAIEAAAMKIKDRDKLRDEGRLPKSDRERGLLALSVLDTFLSVLVAEPDEYKPPNKKGVRHHKDCLHDLPGVTICDCVPLVAEPQETPQ